MEHRLKTWPEYYMEVNAGNKTFELRKNDRDFNVGDTLILEEYDPKLMDGYFSSFFENGLSLNLFKALIGEPKTENLK